MKRFSNSSGTIELVHLSHLHKDHYDGLAPALEFFRESGRRLTSIRIPFTLAVLRSLPVDDFLPYPALSELIDQLDQETEAKTDIQITAQGPFGKSCFFLLPAAFQNVDFTARAIREAFKSTREYAGAPQKDLKRWDNRYSSVLAIECGDQLVLLGGDAPRAAWQSLYNIPINQPYWSGIMGRSACPSALLQTDGSSIIINHACLLKVPHHGANENRLTPSLLLSMLGPRDSLRRSKGPVSVFLCAGSRHPGPNCIREHEQISRRLFLSSIPDNKKLSRSQRRSVSNFFTALGLEPWEFLPPGAFKSPEEPPYPSVKSLPKRYKAWGEGGQESFAAFLFSEDGDARAVVRNFIVGDSETGEYRWFSSEQFVL
ncbi:MAG: hypothetical protein ABUT39_00950 [Acidobacteriota bacterium]